MKIWEIVLIFVGIAFVVLCIYLISLIKKVLGTLGKVDELLDENKVSVGDIMSNVKDVSSDAKTVSNRAAKVVKGIEKAMGPKVTETGISDSVVKTKDAIGIANLSFLSLRFIKTLIKKLAH